MKLTDRYSFYLLLVGFTAGIMGIIAEIDLLLGLGLLFELLAVGFLFIEIKIERRDSKLSRNNSHQEKCGDSLPHQHRHGTHPEEGQVSKENDMATGDNISKVKQRSKNGK